MLMILIGEIAHLKLGTNLMYLFSFTSADPFLCFLLVGFLDDERSLMRILLKKAPITLCLLIISVEVSVINLGVSFVFFLAPRLTAILPSGISAAVSGIVVVVATAVAVGGFPA